MRIPIDNFNEDPWKHISGEDTSGQNLFVREIATRLALAGHFVDVSTRATSPDDKLITSVTNKLRILRFQAGPLMYMFRDNAFQHLDAYTSLLLDFCRQQQHRYQILHGNYWPSAKVVCCFQEADYADVFVYGHKNFL